MSTRDVVEATPSTAIATTSVVVPIAAEAPKPPPTLFTVLWNEACTADWLAVWVGLLCFIPLLPLSATVGNVANSTRVRYMLPQPMMWETDPLSAWDAYNGAFIWLTLLAMLALYMLYLRATGKLTKVSPVRYAVGFSLVALLGTLALWLGRNALLSSYGMSYAMYAIAIGMLLGNLAELSSPLRTLRETWLTPVAKDGEFMIKIALVLYAKSFSVIWSIGLRGLIVGWVGSPLAIAAGWLIGTRVLKMPNRPQVVLLSVGAAWCGASAMAAVKPIVGASGEDLALATSIVVLFTLLFQFVQPYAAIAVQLDESIAGAWIGASVDQTGNVVVSAAIMSEEAAEVGGVVKMILNAGLGAVCLAIAVLWTEDDAASPAGAAVGGGGGKPPSSASSAPPARASSRLWLLWSKFPKFVAGFLFLSLIITLLEIPLAGTAQGVALLRATASMSRWWMCLAFVGIGLATDCKKLLKEVTRGGAVALYLLTNAVDVLLALGLAALCFGAWRDE